MSQVRIVTDSTSDIPAYLQESLGIHVVPLKVHFATETYRDGVDLGSEAFFEKLIASSVLPTTSQPSPVEFLEIYKKLTDESDDPIISIHLSSAMSGTFQSALLAKSMLEEQVDLAVIDSKSASYGFGIQVVAAAEAAKEGKSKEEILQMLEAMRLEMRLYFLLDTLEYLQKGGRIGKAAALIGSLLNIKPILSINQEGEVHSVDKVRGQKKAMNRIIELLNQEFGERPLHIGIAHANALANAEELGSLLKQHFAVKSIRYTSIGPVVGTHTGPGVIAAFVSPVL